MGAAHVDMPVRLPPRPAASGELVSVVVPCFNHGRYLPYALETVRAQTYPSIEMVIVDDGSTDAATNAMVDRLIAGEEPGVRAHRLPRNSGPAVARNTAIDLASGRYILPLDADNELFPSSIADLVECLTDAPSEIGFVYPNIEFFGNRHDVYWPPEYNLFALLHGNYCDTCSLIDRSVFDAGLRYPEGVFREDWHFVVELAKHGIYGRPAPTKTLRFRKRGFNRSDLVGRAKSGPELDAVARELHPEFFGSPRTFAHVKARWCPSLSVILPDAEAAEVEAATERLAAQSFVDFEVLARSAKGQDGPRVPVIRRAVGDRGRGAAGVLVAGVEAARGTHVLTLERAALGSLDDEGFLERLMRTFAGHPSLGAVALVTTDEEFAYSWMLIPRREEIEGHLPVGVAWSSDRLGLGAERVALRHGPLLYQLAVRLAHRASMQWRHVPGPAAPPVFVDAAIDFPVVPGAIPNLEATPAGPRARAPLFPQPIEGARRERTSLYWLPPQSRPLFRHVNRSGQRVVSGDSTPPPGFNFERRLGTVKIRAVPGTKRLMALTPAPPEDASYATRPEEEPLSPEATELGFVETAALPMLMSLRLGRVRATGQWTLLAGAGDPLNGKVDDVTTLGFIEPSPLSPWAPPHSDLAVGAIGLVRAVDQRRQRHVYGVGAIPEDADLVGELGALAEAPTEDSRPVWATADGRLVFDGTTGDASGPALRDVARWAMSPLRWDRGQPLRRRGTAALRRVASSPRLLRRGGGGEHELGVPVGYLYTTPGPKRVALYAARHPVVQDELLTIWPGEPAALGYDEPERLGYLVRYAPVTRSPFGSRFRNPPIPWAWKGGRAAAAARRL